MNTIPQTRKPEDMSRLTGHTIGALVVLLPSLVIGSIGLLIGNGYTAAGLIILWLSVFFSASLQIRRKRTFLVVERFGYFWDIKFAGLRIVIPFVDNQILDEDFLQKQVALFQATSGLEPIKIDFVGGSAAIDSSAWYQIGNPQDIETGNWDNVTEEVLKYTYRVKADERADRIAEIFQGSYRPYLEALSIQEAQDQLEEISEKAIYGDGKRSGAIAALKELGVYPFPGKGIITRDIALPPELIAFREQETRGKADALEAINRSRSYWEPLVQMRAGLENAQIKMSVEGLANLYLAQKGYEMLEKTKSNITLVSPDVKGVLVNATARDILKGADQ